MQPNSQQSPPQAPQPPPPPPATPDPAFGGMDYLNSISTPQPTKTLNPFVLWGVIIGIIGLVVMIVVMLATSGTSPQQSLTEYSLRVSALLEVTEDSQNDVQSSQLRTINSDLSLALTDAEQGVANFQAEKISKKSEAAQTVAKSTAELTHTLDEARLNAVYDRTYARELRYEVANLRTQMTTIYDKSRNPKLKAYLENTDANLKQIATRLDQFTAS